MGKDVMIACDFDSKEKLESFLMSFGDRRPFLKIGMELFYATGPDIVKFLKDRGHKIFLDLKLHDIPNTVGKAMGVISQLGADICNVHAAGTSEMMKAAVKAVTNEDGTRRTKIVAITQLTSTSEERMQRELLIMSNMEDTVIHYALNARNSGLDGVVCSPLEVEAVHKACGKQFLTITPGIRFADSAKGDQVRIMTPADAKKIGSDYIVVGRPITTAIDPVAAYNRCVQEFVD